MELRPLIDDDTRFQTLVNRCTKMSYLLGVATGGIYHLIHDETVPYCQKEPLSRLLEMLHKGCDELYYNHYEAKVKE